MTAGLEVKGLSVSRGGLTICSDVSLSVPMGEITVLLGANGAGKSTLLAGIAGVLPQVSGELQLSGTSFKRLPIQRRAKLGLAYVEQGRSVFSRLTVAQNIAVVDRSRDALDRACDLFPRLAEKRDVPAGVLSGGEQQMLLVARALATQPQVLMVDELSLGLAPRAVDALMDAMVELAGQGVGVLLVEQFVDMALHIGTDAHVMKRGRIVRSESCKTLRENPELLSFSYFHDPGEPQRG